MKKVVLLRASYSSFDEPIYIGDDVNSLREKISVIAYFDDSTIKEVDNYIILDADGTNIISNAKNVIIEYGGCTATFNLASATDNSRGIIYEWDFTKSLTDFRRGSKAVLVGRHEKIAHTDFGNRPSFISDKGIRFGDLAEGLMLLPPSVSLDELVDKTIQIDVASFVPMLETLDTKFLTFGRGDIRVFDSGILYNKASSGWAAYFGPYTGWAGNYSNMSARTAIAAHTIAAYINSEKKIKLYVDGVSKGVSNKAFSGTFGGLMVGSDDYPWDGSTLCISRITGARIYNGDVASTV